jgi:flagellar biosynthesis protein
MSARDERAAAGRTAQQEPARSAVALRWSAGQPGAPRVTAKGCGEVADAILAAARAHGVPVREDKDLVELLAACDLLDEIPSELYAAVARILAYLHALNGERLENAQAGALSTAAGEVSAVDPD